MEIEILFIGIRESNQVNYYCNCIGNNVVSSVNIVFWTRCLFLRAREYRKYVNFFGKCGFVEENCKRIGRNSICCDTLERFIKH